MAGRGEVGQPRARMGIDGLMQRLDDLLNALSPTITAAAVLVREVRVRVGVLPKPVRIRIYYDRGNSA